VKTVRGVSDSALRHVIFEDGTDIYWARSRTLESCRRSLARAAAGATSELGPDATGLG